MSLTNDQITAKNFKEFYEKILPYLGGGGSSWTDVSDTLSAGSTSITLTDSAITTDSLFDYYTSIFGVSPTSATVSNGSITLTFNAQETDMTVMVRVS